MTGGGGYAFYFVWVSFVFGGAAGGLWFDSAEVSLGGVACRVYGFLWFCRSDFFALYLFNHCNHVLLHYEGAAFEVRKGFLTRK